MANDKDIAFILSKLVVLERLLVRSYVELFKDLPDPVKTADAYGEAFRKGYKGLEGPSLREHLAVLNSEHMNEFWDKVTAELQNRSAQKRRPGGDP